MTDGRRKNAMCPQSLRCPSCGGDNLHQVRVEVGFACPKSDLSVTVHREGCDVKAEVMQVCQDAVRIFFACEHCSRSLTVGQAAPCEWSGVSRENLAELRIYQHKGTTYCEWVAWCGPVRTGFVELDDNLA